MANVPHQACTAHGAILQAQISQASSLASVTQHVNGVPSIHFNQPLFWPEGYELKIGFADGDTWQHAQVRIHAVEWLQWANLEFNFVTRPPYDIYISFQPGSSWSLLGKQSEQVTCAFPPEPSMNLGWVDMNPASTDSSDMATHTMRYRATILHEFGHALGMTHEHQNPEKTSQWNQQVVYAHYAQIGWDAQKVNFNILSNVTGRVLRSNFLDNNSIMLYSFPKQLFLNGSGTKENFELSELDKAGMLNTYKGRSFAGKRFSKTPLPGGNTWISQDTLADLGARHGNTEQTLSIDVDWEQKDQAGNWTADGFTVVKLSDEQPPDNNAPISFDQAMAAYREVNSRKRPTILESHTARMNAKPGGNPYTQ